MLNRNPVNLKQDLWSGWGGVKVEIRGMRNIVAGREKKSKKGYVGYFLYVSKPSTSMECRTSIRHQ